MEAGVPAAFQQTTGELFALQYYFDDDYYHSSRWRLYQRQREDQRQITDAGCVESEGAMTGVLLHLIDDSLDIVHKIVKKQFRDEAAKSAFADEWLALLGCLHAIDAILMQESALVSQKVEDHELHREEVKKVERRLRLWSRKPEQINSLVLATFLRLCDEKNRKSVKLETLRERYVQQTPHADSVVAATRTFNQNFWLMTTIGATNHGKVFEVDEDDNVVLWQKVEPAVQKFREEMRIGHPLPG